MDSNATNVKPFERKFRLAEILKDSDESVKFTDFDNFFHIYQNPDSYFQYNINSTVYIDVPSSRLKTYVCQHDMHWPPISFNIYGTVRLAWVLMKVNNITPDIAFNIVPASSEVKYLDRSDITTVIDEFEK